MQAEGEQQPQQHQQLQQHAAGKADTERGLRRCLSSGKKKRAGRFKVLSQLVRVSDMQQFGVMLDVRFTLLDAHTAPPPAADVV